MKITRFWIIVWATLIHLDARTYVVSPQGNDAVTLAPLKNQSRLFHQVQEGLNRVIPSWSRKESIGNE